MATGINGTIGLLQAINLDIDGVRTAPTPDNYPRGEILEVDMPCVLVFTEDGNGTRFAIGLNRIERTYVLTVICRHQTTGIQTENMYATHDLMDKFLKRYLNEALIQAPSPTQNEILIVHPQVVQASGWQENIMVNGNEYHGFTITLQIHEKGDLS